MREKKEEIIGASCLVVFNALSRLSEQTPLGITALNAIEKALAVIPRVPGEILSRIDFNIVPTIINALTETEAYLNDEVEVLESKVDDEIEDDRIVGRLMYLERLLKECQRALMATGRRLIVNKSYRLWVPLDIWIMAVDETECWQLKDEDLDKCERIEGIYLFDKNETRKYGNKSCYFLWGLNNRPVFKENVSDDDKNRIRRLIKETGEIADNYSPIGTVNKDIKKISDDEFRCYHFGNPNFDWASDYGRDDDKKREIMRIICNWCSEMDILAKEIG